MRTAPSGCEIHHVEDRVLGLFAASLPQGQLELLQIAKQGGAVMPIREEPANDSSKLP